MIDIKPKQLCIFEFEIEKDTNVEIQLENVDSFKSLTLLENSKGEIENLYYNWREVLFFEMHEGTIYMIFN